MTITKNPESPHKSRYETLCGYYDNSTKLYEHSIYNGHLMSTKIFNPTGDLVNEVAISTTGQITSLRNFLKNKKVSLQLEPDPKTNLLSFASIYNDKSNLIYKGGYFNGKKNGPGVAYNQCGVSLYEGQFFNNKFHGEGIKFFEEGGPEYQGRFKDNKYYGKGTLFYKNGKPKYEGNWKENLCHGPGKMFSEEGLLEYDGYYSEATKYFTGTKFVSGNFIFSLKKFRHQGL
jgi:antitoxin component YwqK of YwqJK toxin-antitoxin module